MGITQFATRKGLLHKCVDSPQVVVVVGAVSLILLVRQNYTCGHKQLCKLFSPGKALPCDAEDRDGSYFLHLALQGYDLRVFKRYFHVLERMLTYCKRILRVYCFSMYLRLTENLSQSTLQRNTP